MRMTYDLNRDWTFLAPGAKKPKRVRLPHTWNNLDGQDGGNDYLRGTARYERTLPSSIPTDCKRVYLEVPAAAMSAEVFLNGEFLTRHEGGFSTFRKEFTGRLTGRDTLALLVDNGENERVYPQFADFTFFGGLYRGANLVAVAESHFSLTDDGGEGLHATPLLSEDNARASVAVEVLITNPRQNQRVLVTLLEESGKVAAQCEAEAAERVSLSLELENPRLWEGLANPYLYTVRAELADDGGVLDGVQTRVGIRRFAIDPERGFFLNGKPYPLRGVARHQDRLNKGWAITQEDQREDIAMIREMGANTIRLAHYQHSQYFLDLCDKTGMVVWAEIPYISRHMPLGRENTIRQMTELVKQNWNHPSIACWGISNEITIGGESEELLENHRALNALCHQLDPSRPTAMACLSMLETDSPLLKIPDILSYNHYFGWYGADVEDNAPWLDAFHKAHPQTCLGLSEYGAEGILRWHTDAPKMGDYSEEYQAFYHERMLRVISERPYLWSTHVWNMFDFASDIRDEGGVKGRNNKGLVTYDRGTRKDSFYVYKAWWSSEPFVHLAGKRYIDRTGETARVTVYSNQPRVELSVGGRFAASLEADKVFVFDVPLKKHGNTRIRVCAGTCEDKAAFRRVNKPNPAYSLDTAPGAVSSWADKDGKTVVLAYPEGYFSIRDKIGDIMATEQGRALLEAMIESAMNGLGGRGFTLNEQMRKMAYGLSVERAIKMAGKHLESAELLALNEALNKIKKP
ncbi:MAG: glycoside hydrolase family 2 TIM barrel-domain containing protein [Clostridiaceae bacterium]